MRMVGKGSKIKGVTEKPEALACCEVIQGSGDVAFVWLHWPQPLSLTAPAKNALRRPARFGATGGDGMGMGCSVGHREPQAVQLGWGHGCKC